MNKKLLIDIFSHQSPSGNRKMQHELARFIAVYCQRKGECICHIDTHGNLYITKGASDIYPCVVAHLDTVHSVVDDFQILIHKDYLFAMNGIMQQVGCGGDDRAGIYIALQMFEQFENIKLAFFTDEEIGGIGSNSADMDFFKDVAFVVQPDRNHYRNDYINHTNGFTVTSEEFDAEVLAIISKYDYTKATGTFTDIGVLKENGLDVCCFNISCGYFYAHSTSEVVHLPSLLKCQNAVSDIIKNLSYKKWEHKASFHKGKYDYRDYFKFNNLDSNVHDDYYEDYYNDYYDGEYADYEDIEADCQHLDCDMLNFEEDLDGNVFCRKCQKNVIIYETDEYYDK